MQSFKSLIALLVIALFLGLVASFADASHDSSCPELVRELTKVRQACAQSQEQSAVAVAVCGETNQTCGEITLLCPPAPVCPSVTVNEAAKNCRRCRVNKTTGHTRCKGCVVEPTITELP